MTHAAWMSQADSDLNAARALSEGGFHSQAVWFAAQAVEKGHKAILAALGLRYEDKHYRQLGHGTGEIAKMLPAPLHEPADPDIARMVSVLENRASTCRYPGPDQTVSGRASALVAPASFFSSSVQDVADASRLLDWCKERVGRAVRAAEMMKPVL